MKIQSVVIVGVARKDRRNDLVSIKMQIAPGLEHHAQDSLNELRICPLQLADRLAKYAILKALD
jgi:hypothetical protein